MTSYHLFKVVPLRQFTEKGSPLDKGLCGHCGEFPTLHKISYFCERCYRLMHIGDTDVFVGLAGDINDMMKGNVKKEYADLPPLFQKTVIVES